MKPALLLAILALLGSPGVATAQLEYWGEIKFFPYEFCPVGYLPADGRLLPIGQNTQLFSLIGTRFGGNGTTHFALPTLKPLKSEFGGVVTPCIANTGIFPPRD
jgi:microcystin-dependent protein